MNFILRKKDSIYRDWYYPQFQASSMDFGMFPLQIKDWGKTLSQTSQFCYRWQGREERKIKHQKATLYLSFLNVRNRTKHI